MRAAVPGDGLGIETVRVLGWQTAYRGLVPDEALDAMSPEVRAPRWDEQLAGAVGKTFVSVADGLVTGFAGVGPSRDDDVEGAELYAIYVRPSAWGSGAGQALLDAALAAHPGVPVVLWVLAGNARARAFYARNGFVPDGLTKGYETGGVTIPELRLRLER